MEHLSTWTETEGGKVLAMGKEAIPKGETVDSEVELRNQLIDLISVGNLKHTPQALFTLFRQFLTRISLPRLIHFMDLVLPQLTPVQAAWAGEEKTLWSCHYIRWLSSQLVRPALTIKPWVIFFFSSLAERAITAVPVTALPYEAFVTSSKMPRFHQAETHNKRTQNQATKQKTNNATPTTPKPKTKHLSGNRVANYCTTYN